MPRDTKRTRKHARLAAETVNYIEEQIARARAVLSDLHRRDWESRDERDERVWGTIGALDYLTDTVAAAIQTDRPFADREDAPPLATTSTPAAAGKEAA